MPKTLFEMQLKKKKTHDPSSVIAKAKRESKSEQKQEQKVVARIRTY